jgi:RNA polymerase sigma factor (TIGR02999 family)
VHSVYLRLIGDSAVEENAWNGRGHFFAAAALAMRRILVERARTRGRLRHGAGHRRVEAEALDALPVEASPDPVDVLALDVALRELEAANLDQYRVVMLRYFAGLSIAETAALLDTSVNSIKRRWNVARLWLLDRMDGHGGGPADDAADQHAR